ncbi:MAG: ParB/RepB/Spo0J family partition protein [Spirochaetota bacterium]
MAKRALGKGLGAIISNTPKAPAEATEQAILSAGEETVIELPIDSIRTNPDQPRHYFDEQEIEYLSESIRSVGLIQPIIVRRQDDLYYIIACERRFRAVKLLERDTIRAIVMKASEEENVTLALIENIQRQDLDPIEEAKAYKLLINRFKLKQSDVAQRVGKDRATIANSLRLLSLPENMQEAVSSGVISQGHAKILAGLPADDKQYYFDQIISKGLSVRALEAMIKEDETSGTAGGKGAARKDPHIKKMEDHLVSVLGTKVEIRHSTTGKGKIEINYYSLDDFERIVEQLGH